MFNKILVCLDGSELAERVLPYAVEEAVRFNSELVLFRVISEPSMMSLAMPGLPGVPVDTVGMERRAVEDEKEAAEYLKKLAAKVQAENNLRVTYDTVRGVAGPTIVDYCLKNEIELVAMATHGRTGPGRVVLGSVADYVIRNSGLPILLIRPVKGK